MVVAGRTRDCFYDSKDLEMMEEEPADISLHAYLWAAHTLGSLPVWRLQPAHNLTGKGQVMLDSLPFSWTGLASPQILKVCRFKDLGCWVVWLYWRASRPPSPYSLSGFLWMEFTTEHHELREKVPSSSS
jgi:hypothetical protein